MSAAVLPSDAVTAIGTNELIVNIICRSRSKFSLLVLFVPTKCTKYRSIIFARRSIAVT